MQGDAKLAYEGMVVVHRSGTAAKLKERKRRGEDRLPGWWVAGGGGLADIALESNDWLLLTPERIKRLWADAMTGEDSEHG